VRRPRHERPVPAEAAVGDDQVQMRMPVGAGAVGLEAVGRADSTTIQLPAGLDYLSVNAIRSVLPAWRFIPAYLGGCAVKQVVRLTFSRK
jgi:hypothetical protein